MGKILISIISLMAICSGASNAKQITFEQLIEIRDLACRDHKTPEVCKEGVNIIMYNTDKIAQFHGACEQMKKDERMKSLYDENEDECKNAANFVQKAKSLLKK